MNHDDERIAALEARIAALEKQIAYLTERDQVVRESEFALAVGGVI